MSTLASMEGRAEIKRKDNARRHDRSCHGGYDRYNLHQPSPEPSEPGQTPPASPSAPIERLQTPPAPPEPYFAGYPVQNGPLPPLVHNGPLPTIVDNEPRPPPKDLDNVFLPQRLPMSPQEWEPVSD